MKRLLRWLNPNTILRGLLFGYLFGLVWGIALLVVFVCRSQQPVAALERNAELFPVIFVMAIPWALIWGGSAIASTQIPGHPGTTSTLFAVGCATAYTLNTSTFGGWTPLVLIWHTFIAVIPCHMLGYCIAALFGRIRDPEEAQ